MSWELAVDLFTIIGLTGVGLYVTCYAALQFEVLDGNGAVYSIGNVVAASLVLVSLTRDFNLASAATQVIWIAIGLGGLAKRFWRKDPLPAVATTSSEPGLSAAA